MSEKPIGAFNAVVMAAAVIMTLACRDRANLQARASDRATATRALSAPARSANDETIEDYEFPNRHELPRFTPPPTNPPAPPRTTLVRVLSPTMFVVRSEDKTQLVRLGGVGEPQDCGTTLGRFDAEAQRFLNSLLEGKELRLEHAVQEPDGTVTAVVRARAPQRYENVADASGTYVNIAMIQNGYGCVGSYGLFECPESFPRAEEIARAHYRGMWRHGPALANGFVSQADNALRVLRDGDARTDEAGNTYTTPRRRGLGDR